MNLRIAAALAASWAAFLVSAIPAHAKVSVFSCEPEWASLVREVGGEDVDVFAATSPRQDPHHIEARPALVARLRQANLLICTGAELEIGWLPVLLRQAANPAVQASQPGHLEVASHFQLLDKPDHVDRSMGDIHAAGNPHLHLDPRVLRNVAALVGDRLAEIDPAHAAGYRARQASFQQRLDAAIVRWEARSTPLIGAKVIAHHADTNYLFAWLGIKQVAFLEPKPGVPPGAAQLAQLVATAPQLGAQAVVHSAYQSPQAATFVADKLHLPVVTLPYTVGGDDRAKDLFGLFDDAIDRLMAAIRRAP